MVESEDTGGDMQLGRVNRLWIRNTGVLHSNCQPQLPVWQIKRNLNNRAFPPCRAPFGLTSFPDYFSNAIICHQH